MTLSPGPPAPPCPRALQMKQWLMSAGREAMVWELTNKRAKKAEFAAAVRQVAGL